MISSLYVTQTDFEYEKFTIFHRDNYNGNTQHRLLTLPVAIRSRICNVVTDNIVSVTDKPVETKPQRYLHGYV